MATTPGDSDGTQARGNKLLTCVPSGSLAQLERWVEHSADAHGTGPPARAVLHQKRQNQGPPRPDLIHLEVRAAFDGLQTTS